MSLFRTLPALLILIAGLAGAGPLRAQQASPGGSQRPVSSLTPADIERLTSLLQDEARRAEFLRTLEALAEASRAHGGYLCRMRVLSNRESLVSLKVPT